MKLLSVHSTERSQHRSPDLTDSQPPIGAPSAMSREVIDPS
jgi:hypothetical protein